MGPGRTCSVGSPPTSVILDQENDGLSPAQVVNENVAVCPSKTVALTALVFICGTPKLKQIIKFTLLINMHIGHIQ